MGKTGIKAGGETQHSFLKVKTHSIADILAAGGATGFANKMGKKPQNLVRRLKNLPQEDFLTADEANLALESLSK
jgi:hypothetical protein